MRKESKVSACAFKFYFSFFFNTTAAAHLSTGKIRDSTCTMQFSSQLTQDTKRGILSLYLYALYMAWYTQDTAYSSVNDNIDATPRPLVEMGIQISSKL
jgi:hypothetical protein